MYGNHCSLESQRKLKTLSKSVIIYSSTNKPRASPVAQMVKNLPAMQETWVWSLGWEDPLEKGMATHSSILAWRIPWTEEPGSYSPWGHKEMDTTERLSLSVDSERELGE